MGKKALGIVSVVALTAVLALFAWPAEDSGEPPSDRGGSGLPRDSREVTSERLSERLLELTFASDGLDPPLRAARVRVLLPTGYRSSQRRYPVLYLLHGAGDRYSAWTENGGGWPVTLEEFTADKDVVVVMPDGGTPDHPGWYSDWYNGGRLGPPGWETFHIERLIPYIEEHFRVREDRDGRVVAGLSMGGFGAMSYAARHPDLFAGAFSFSGALDAREFDAIVAEGVWGDQETRYLGHDPSSLAPNLRGVRVWFRTGEGRPGGPAPDDGDPTGLAIEETCWQTNEAFAEALDAAGVPFDYRSYPEGAHNWWHWQRGLQEFAWPEIEEVFRADTPSRPDRFGYRSIEPHFGVWGWTFKVERDATEFLYLEGVREEGLELRGSGMVRVVTPPAYVPGAGYDVSVTGSAGNPSPRVKADESGRLRFAIELGQSRRFGQSTAPDEPEAAGPDDAGTASVRIARRQ